MLGHSKKNYVTHEQSVAENFQRAKTKTTTILQERFWRIKGLRRLIYAGFFFRFLIISAHYLEKNNNNSENIRNIPPKSQLQTAMLSEWGHLVYSQKLKVIQEWGRWCRPSTTLDFKMSFDGLLENRLRIEDLRKAYFPYMVYTRSSIFWSPVRGLIYWLRFGDYLMF